MARSPWYTQASAADRDQGPRTYDEAAFRKLSEMWARESEERSNRADARKAKQGPGKPAERD